MWNRQTSDGGVIEKGGAPLKLHRTTLDTCAEIRGTVVVIDVIRAFTAAAVAFDRGAEAIYLTRTAAEAFELRDQLPEALLVGEEDALPIAGFDFNNSPAQLAEADLSGRILIQRTTAGTQGAVGCTAADTVLTTGFTCALATVGYLRIHRPRRVTFLLTGVGEGLTGDEDTACADYLAALLTNARTDPMPFLSRVRKAPGAAKFLDPSRPAFSAADLDHCLRADIHPFAMRVTGEGECRVLRPVTPSGAAIR